MQGDNKECELELTCVRTMQAIDQLIELGFINRGSKVLDQGVKNYM